MVDCVFAVLNDPPCIVTKDGRIFAVNRRFNQPQRITERRHIVTGSGYAQVRINNKAYLAHRLIAEAFFGKCPEDNEVDHIDRNKLNNDINNLRYVSRSENMLNRSFSSRFGHGFWSGMTKEARSTYNREYRGQLKEKGFYYGSVKIDGKWKTVKQPIENMKRR